MRDWHRHWQEYPAGQPETALFEQVGKTVNKRPIPLESLYSIVSSIESNLLLTEADSVLDLCCGNGLITNLVAQHCRTITGIDFSELLIKIANKYNQPGNVEYVCGIAGDVKSLLSHNIQKAYMYEALQHFTPTTMAQLLDHLRGLFGDSQFKFFVGSVPDKAKRWKFYNTISRRLDFLIRSMRQEEAIGTWWSRETIVALCREKKLKVNFMEQNPMLHTAHYRFDMLITE